MNLDQLEHDKDGIIMQILWHYRHTDPNMCVRITEQDVVAMEQCMEHNKQVPVVRITRTGTAPFLFVAMTDEQSNAIVPVENNLEDYEKGEQARRRLAVKESIGQLAARVKNAAAIGEFSSSEVSELADAALLLAK